MFYMVLNIPLIPVSVFMYTIILMEPQLSKDYQLKLFWYILIVSCQKRQVQQFIKCLMAKILVLTFYEALVFGLFCQLNISAQCCTSYINQSFDLHYKSNGRFLYEVQHWAEICEVHTFIKEENFLLCNIPILIKNRVVLT